MRDLAGQITLQATDIPPRRPGTPTPTGGPINLSLAISESCFPRTIAAPAGQAFSNGFANGASATWGLVVVTESDSLASSAFSAFTGPSFKSCARAMLERGLMPPLSGRTATVTRVPLAPVASRTGSFTIVVKGTTQGSPRTTVFQFAWAQSGRAVVGAIMESTTIPDQTQLRSELQAMVSRAKALAP